MEQQKMTRKFILWNTVCVIIITCIVNAVIWILFHGIPLIGLPKKENVKSVTIIYNETQKREITDNETIELLVKSANLLNYQLWGQTEDSPIIDIIYHLKDGEDIKISANNNTMWWHGKSHTIKETNTFVNIMQGMFFNLIKLSPY